MTTPPKPWEVAGNVNHRQANYQPDLSPSFMPSAPHMMPGPGGGGSTSMLNTARSPPVPPRPSSHQPHSSHYNNFPLSSYNNYGNMGMGMGMYGSTYRGYGQHPLPPLSGDNRFIRIAEDSSRQAFQSIESIVSAFGSVSMMLESTYHAVYSSFRAVLGVADHFSRMKSHFGQIFSALAIVRTLRWLYRKLLFLIGLRYQDPSLEAAWQRARASLQEASEITEADIKASKSSWPILLFFAVVLGGPYLIWRLLSSLVPKELTTTQKWAVGRAEHYAAVGLYTFQAKSKNELSFVAGQSLFLAPRDQQPSIRGWLLASNGRNMGLVPANHIKILGLRTPPQQDGSHQAQGNQALASSIPPHPAGSHPATVPDGSIAGRQNAGIQPLHGQNTRAGLPSVSQTEVLLGRHQGQSVPINQQRQWQPHVMLEGQRPPNQYQGHWPPPVTYQGHVPPLVTHEGHMAPLVTQQRNGQPPIIQHRQIPSRVTQQGHGPPPPVTQQGHGPPPPLIQQGHGPPPPVTQQGHGLPPPVTQQGHGPPLPVTQQGHGPPPPVTQQGHGPPPPVTQQGHGPPPPVTQQGHGPPPPITQQGHGPPIVGPTGSLSSSPQENTLEGPPLPSTQESSQSTEGEELLSTYSDELEEEEESEISQYGSSESSEDSDSG